MAITKSKLFEKDQVRIAAFAKALSHPARIAILQILALQKSCICGDITNQLPLAQSTVSQHLKALKSAGIIKGEIDGPRTCYCINGEVLSELKSEIDNLLIELTTINKNCC